MGIKAAANRAAGLVSKLLAFSRQQTLQTEVVQLGELISEITPLIKRSVGVRIDLKVSTERDLWLVKTDKTQIDRVIVNLAVNARDAMPDGGTLSIRTRNVTEREFQKMDHFGLAVGEYVLVEVEDTGCGMSAEERSNLFKPFHTSKRSGTGLGLVIVKKMLSTMNGTIKVQSDKNKGTTVMIFIPEDCAAHEEKTSPDYR